MGLAPVKAEPLGTLGTTAGLSGTQLCWDAGSALRPPKCGVLLLTPSKFSAQGGELSAVVSPSLSSGTNPNSGCSALGTQCASQGTSMSSTSTAFAG